MSAFVRFSVCIIRIDSVQILCIISIEVCIGDMVVFLFLPCSIFSFLFYRPTLIEYMCAWVGMGMCSLGLNFDGRRHTNTSVHGLVWMCALWV